MTTYKVTTDIKSESSGINFMDVGIHTDCIMGRRDNSTPIVYNKTETSEFLAFYFINEDKEELSHTEWKPRSQSNDETELEKKTLNQIKRIKHIATKFIDEEEFVFEVDTFEQFAKKVIELIGNKYVDVKVRLKVTYNNANYTSLPNYTPFIERMDLVPQEKSKLKIITAMDKMIRDTADREASTNNNPFETEAKTDIPETKELPF